MLSVYVYKLFVERTNIGKVEPSLCMCGRSTHSPWTRCLSRGKIAKGNDCNSLQIFRASNSDLAFVQPERRKISLTTLMRISDFEHSFDQFSSRLPHVQTPFYMRSWSRCYFSPVLYRIIHHEIVLCDSPEAARTLHVVLLKHTPSVSRNECDERIAFSVLFE